MPDQLAGSLDSLAQTFIRLSDEELARPWSWRDYDDDGVRFALFRTYEELVELAAELRDQRAGSSQPLTQAQRMLGEYRRAFWDLDPRLMIIDNELAEQAPAPREWSVRETLEHILRGDLGFYTVVKHAQERVEAGLDPSRPDEADWSRITGLDDDGYEELMSGSFADLFASYAQWHQRICQDLSALPDELLQAPSRYWEEEPYPLSFRMLRFASHLTQHSVQIEKTLQEILGQPSEAVRLLARLAAARADVEAARLGAPGLGDERLAQLAAAWQTRQREVETALANKAS